MAEQDPAAIEEAATLVAAGVKVPIAAVYRLSEIKKASSIRSAVARCFLDIAEG